jgi:hypothetical protein
MEESIRTIVIVMNEARATIICTSIATIRVILVTVLAPVSTSVKAICTPVLALVCHIRCAVGVVLLA